MTKAKNKKIFSIGIFILTILLAGCGGGSSTDSGNDDPNTEVNETEGSRDTAEFADTTKDDADATKSEEPLTCPMYNIGDSWTYRVTHTKHGSLESEYDSVSTVISNTDSMIVVESSNSNGSGYSHMKYHHVDDKIIPFELELFDESGNSSKIFYSSKTPICPIAEQGDKFVFDTGEKTVTDITEKEKVEVPAGTYISSTLLKYRGKDSANRFMVAEEYYVNGIGIVKHSTEIEGVVYLHELTSYSFANENPDSSGNNSSPVDTANDSTTTKSGIYGQIEFNGADSTSTSKIFTPMLNVSSENERAVTTSWTQTISSSEVIVVTLSITDNQFISIALVFRNSDNSQHQWSLFCTNQCDNTVISTDNRTITFNHQDLPVDRNNVDATAPIKLNGSLTWKKPEEN